MSVSLFHGVLRAPFFCWLFACSCLAWGDSGGIRSFMLPVADYALAREALVDAIEAEGLVISHTSNFAAMLNRTAKDLGQETKVYREAESFHFCSSRAAWMLALESLHSAATCPMGVSIYQANGSPGSIYFAYRPWPGHTPAQVFGNDLLARIVGNALASLGN